MSKKFLPFFIVLFVLGAAPQLNADPSIDLNVPPGSYHDSCHSCWIVLKEDVPGQVKPPYLRCVCLNKHDYIEAKLPIDRPPHCKDIDNEDGKLLCIH